MARPYSLDLRERILKNYDNATPIEDLVQHYEVSRSTLYSHIKQRRETGNITPKEYKRGRKNKLAPYEQEVRKVIAEHPDGTLVDFCELLSVHFIVFPATMSNYLHQLKITRKKTLISTEQHRADVAEQRKEWQQLQSVIDEAKLVFIDETWAKTNMTPLYGWAPIGKRVVDDVPHGQRKTTTFIAALRCDGLTAPMVIDGAINGELFLAYVEQVLVNTLREGDIVVLDNLSSHKVVGVKQAIERVGAQVVYLPLYSPDLNPIEMVFSKLKTLLRKAKLRTMDELWKRLGELCDVFSKEECKNYFKHAGYKRQTSRPVPNMF